MPPRRWWRGRRTTGSRACRGRRRPFWWVTIPAVLLTGCSNSSPSTLSPGGPKADSVATLWWVLFWISVVVSVAVIAMMLWAVLFRRRVDTKVRHDSGQRFVFVLGVAIPAMILIATFGLSVGGIARNADPPTPTQVTIEVTAHRWWWEARYPEAGVVTANEIHVPARTPVRLRLKTADVIHSFWVPELMPKVDMLPRRVNETWLSADQPGVYRGQCAEYCGVQHANMAFYVVAQPPAEFAAWLNQQAQPAQEPDTEQERLGREVIETSTCATCHTVRGTSADGTLGPELTHVGSRDHLAAGAIPNTFGHMSGWVSNSQTVKPGNRMPPQQLSPDELRAVVTYLQSLQ